MITPDPIEGWSFHVSGLPGKLQWEARWNERLHRAWFDELGLNVTGYGDDSYEYDVSYIVPLRVIDKLRELQHAETPQKVPGTAIETKRREVLTGALMLVQITEDVSDLAHALDLCAHFHPDGPLTAAELELLKASI